MSIIYQSNIDNPAMAAVTNQHTHGMSLVVALV